MAGEVVRVVNMTSSTHTLTPTQPPGVMDLVCIAMSHKNRTVTLQWTAVGDYLNERGEDSASLLLNHLRSAGGFFICVDLSLGLGRMSPHVNSEVSTHQLNLFFCYWHSRDDYCHSFFCVMVAAISYLLALPMKLVCICALRMSV